LPGRARRPARITGPGVTVVSDSGRTFPLQRVLGFGTIGDTF